MLENLEWVGQHNYDEEGQHVFFVRTYIGKVGGLNVSGTSPALQGMYESNYIDSTATITLKVTNPCNTATLTIPTLTKNLNGDQVEIFEAREWGG